MALINENMPKRSMRINYNEGYDDGVAHRETWGTITGGLATHETRLAGAITGLRNAKGRSMESESYATNALYSQGFIDGLKGSKRMLRMTFGIVGPSEVSLPDGDCDID